MRNCVTLCQHELNAWFLTFHFHKAQSSSGSQEQLHGRRSVTVLHQGVQSRFQRLRRLHGEDRCLMFWRWRKICYNCKSSQNVQFVLPQHTIIGNNVTGTACILEDVAACVQFFNNSHLQQLLVPNMSFLRYPVQNGKWSRFNFSHAFP